jgi:hypothetical protein
MLYFLMLVFLQLAIKKFKAEGVPINRLRKEDVSKEE